MIRKQILAKFLGIHASYISNFLARNEKRKGDIQKVNDSLKEKFEEYKKFREDMLTTELEELQKRLQ